MCNEPDTTLALSLRLPITRTHLDRYSTQAENASGICCVAIEQIMMSNANVNALRFDVYVY